MKFRNEINVWGIYFLTILCSVFIHELGHCVPAWFNGVPAIPTLAKEYALSDISPDLQPYVSLGGIAGTIFFSLLIFGLYLFRSSKNLSAILAGALAAPGLYAFFFLLKGRGHDATEFQEAQSALGFHYAGHAVDWMFIILFFLGIFIWLIKSRPTYFIIGRLLLGCILTIVFMAGLQKINNAVFDPSFESSTSIKQN